MPSVKLNPGAHDLDWIEGTLKKFEGLCAAVEPIDATEGAELGTDDGPSCEVDCAAQR
jgi:hypothetical protein